MWWLIRTPINVEVGHRKNRAGANSPNPVRAVAALSSTVRFELGVAFFPGRLGVSLRRFGAWCCNRRDYRWPVVGI